MVLQLPRGLHHRPVQCISYAFNPDGSMNFIQQCMSLNETTMFMCPTLCDPATADLCGDPSNPTSSYCAPKGSCPPPMPKCTMSQQLCYGQNASTLNTIQDVGVCMDALTPCPCPVNSHSCTDTTGYLYCLPQDFQCPVSCGDPLVNQTCTVIGYMPDGSIDWSSLANTVCMPVSATCPCGSNALSCSYTDMYGLNNTYCQAQVVDGLTTQCPLTCSTSQQLCYTVNYDNFGNVSGYAQSCAGQTATCPCGTNTALCTDGWGGSYCLPNLDSFGNVNLLNVTTSCVVAGTPCPCPASSNGISTNAFQCNVTLLDGTTESDCMPLVYRSYCPATCPAGQVACPAYASYNPDGSFNSMGSLALSEKCAPSLANCTCGGTKANAQQCSVNGQSFCYPSSQQCPLDCKDTEQLCYIANYNSTGGYLSQTQECVRINAICRCGRNAVPSNGVCVSGVQAQAISPCDASKDTCWVEDFTKDGVSLGKNASCVNKGDQCLCGKNARSCPDPNDATQNICIPQTGKDGTSSCPLPCTPDQEVNMTTCVQTNLAATSPAALPVSRLVLASPARTRRCAPAAP